MFILNIANKLQSNKDIIAIRRVSSVLRIVLVDWQSENKQNYCYVKIKNAYQLSQCFFHDSQDFFSSALQRHLITGFQKQIQFSLLSFFWLTSWWIMQTFNRDANICKFLNLCNAFSRTYLVAKTICISNKIFRPIII